jgi:hypothetical protein
MQSLIEGLVGGSGQSQSGHCSRFWLQGKGNGFPKAWISYMGLSRCPKLCNQQTWGQATVLGFGESR